MQVAQLFSDFHFLPSLHYKLKIQGSLKHQDDRAAQTEPTHLLRFRQWLASEHR